MIGMADHVAQEHLRLVRIKEDFIAAACPFHKDGQETHPSFWINRTVGNWGCFSCTAQGGSLKWLLRKLGISNKGIEAQLEEAEKEGKQLREIDKLAKKKKARKEFKGEFILPEALLGVYDWLPTKLVEEGFTQETLLQHDIGFDQENERITFPIRDLFGNLIGISGRAIVPFNLPRYLVYSGKRIVKGKEVPGELGEWYSDYSNEGMRNHLWGMHEIYEDIFNSTDGQLIIVEGYKARMWLVQHGWLNTVALMGSRMSATQERIVRKLGCETFIFLDNDRAGREGTRKICQRLGISTFPVYKCNYPETYETEVEDSEDLQPDDLIDAELEQVLNTAQRVGGKPNV